MSFHKSIPKITVGRYAGTPIDQLPNSYLRWMMTQDFPKEWLDIADRKLKQSHWNDEYLNVSRHAIDTFSLRFLDKWVKFNEVRQAEGESPLGLGTFITQCAKNAWERGVDISKHRHQEDGIVKEFEGQKWVFGLNYAYPDYKEVITVMPSEG